VACHPSSKALTKEALIQALALDPHVEGGYFRRTYTSPVTVAPVDSAPVETAPVDTDSGKAAMSSIFYLLTEDSPVGHLHRNRSDILHFWQAGDPLRYTLLSPEGELRTVIVGPNVVAGQQLQLLVPGGTWKASALMAEHSSAGYGLISEAVCPGFDFADHSMADAEQIKRRYPQHWPTLASLVRP